MPSTNDVPEYLHIEMQQPILLWPQGMQMIMNNNEYE